MRKVDLQHDAVDTDGVPVVEAVFVVDEAAPEVLAEQFRRPGIEVDGLVVAVALPHEVAALKDVGHPADTPLGERYLQAGELLKLPQNSRSTVDHIRFEENNAMATANGASVSWSWPATGFIDENENPGT